MRYNLIYHYGYKDSDNSLSKHKYAFYCNNCGSEVVARDTQYKVIAEDFQISMDVSFSDCECPLCGEKLVRRSGYYMPDYMLLQKQYGKGRLLDKNIIHPSDEVFLSFYGEPPVINQRWNIKMLQEDIGDHFDKWTPLRPKRDPSKLTQTTPPDSFALWFERMAQIREKAERPHEQALRKAEAFAQSCDIPYGEPIPANAVSEIKANHTKFMEYLQNLITVEGGIYSLTQRLASLYYQLDENQRYIVACANLPFVEERKKLTVAPKILSERAYQLSNAPLPRVQGPERPQEPVFATPGLFNKKKVLAENEALKVQYKRDLEAYNALIRKLEEEAKTERAAKVDALYKECFALKQQKTLLAKKVAANMNAPSPANAIKSILESEIQEAEKLMGELFAARNKLYAYNIIFVKYRNAVAVSSFSEYFTSGRCTALEGANGAYSIFENEIRMNTVITKLDNILSSLEQIKQNQYVMYTQMQRINASLNTLSRTMDQALQSIRSIEAQASSMDVHLKQISNNTNVIAHNTAVAAYYSKINAELTNALGFMIALT